MERFDALFYKGKKVLITGHTGFKGTWLCQLLIEAGAEVTGYALEPVEGLSLFTLTNMQDRMCSITGDIRDLLHLEKVFQERMPEIVIHMAAQPLVRESYNNPVYTYETNVMGTVNVCECVRRSQSVKSFVNVTTDKVYENREWVWPYRETDNLDGSDPYSNSKSCSELVTHSYIRSFYKERGLAASTVRAGNVIGGGDFSKDRIVPDCIRAAMENKSILLRNPIAVRPYQHVLEALRAYLLVAAKQYDDPEYAGSYNVGPEEQDCITTAQLAELFCRFWGEGIYWEERTESDIKEDILLRLDSSLLKKKFGWHPRWSVDKAVEKTVDWTKKWLEGQNPIKCMEEQIQEFMSEDGQRRGSA